MCRGRTRVLISKQGRDYKAAVANAAGRREKATGRLSIDVKLSAPTKRRYDLDNRLKALQDALQGAGIFDDDEQIDIITVTRLPPGGGYCDVTIEELSQ